jgi:hypothetical protein
MSIYFQTHEYRCPCGCGLDSLDYSVLEKLDRARTKVGFPISLSSGCRCRTYNTQIGGSALSAHTPDYNGRTHAVDVRCVHSLTRWKLVNAFLEVGFDRIEVCDKHIHVDNAEHLPHPAFLWGKSK